MANLLQKLAVTKLWQNIHLDKIHNLKLHRLSNPVTGVIGRITLPFNIQTLPDGDSKWHVFQIGKIPSYYSEMSLRDKEWMRATWRRLDLSCTASDVFVTVYDKYGVRAAYMDVYHLWTNDGNFLLAIKDNKQVPLDYTGDIYTRFYSNAYFKSIHTIPVTTGIAIESVKVSSPADIASMQNKYVVYQNRPTGKVLGYVNGQSVENISLLTVPVGSYVDIVYDESIKYITDVALSKVHTYRSKDTNVDRYILHRPKDLDNSIYHRDDVDLQLVHKVMVNGTMQVDGGLYIPNAESTTLHTLTHRDYGLMTSIVTPVYDKLRTLTTLPATGEDTYIRWIVRDDGWDRDMSTDSHRVLDLYCMDDIDVIKSLSGIEGPTFWRADELETSGLSKIFSVKQDDLTPSLAIDALGYNGVSKYLGDGYVTVIDIDGVRSAPLPSYLQTNVTVYEYDIDGLYITYNVHLSGTVYVNMSANCTHIEVLKGIVVGADGRETGGQYGTGNIPIDPDYNVRVYLGDIVNAATFTYTNWLDITEQTELYSIIDNVVTPVGGSVDTGKILYVVQDNRIIMEVIPNGSFTDTGLIEHRPLIREDRGDGMQTYWMDIPYGEMDVFYNNLLLIEGLDYRVKADNTIVFIVGEYNVGTSSTPQNIVIRHRGFPKKDFTRTAQRDVGFILEGRLSTNDVYNIHKDKSVHVTIDGKLRNIDTVPLEDGDGVALPTTLNGKPYQIKDVMLPFRDLVDGEDTYGIRERSIDRDHIVRTYLTGKLSSTEPNIFPIHEKHKVISPVIFRLIRDIFAGLLETEIRNMDMSEKELGIILQPYLDDHWIYDPLNEDLNTDYRYVDVIPHIQGGAMLINPFMFTFLQRVVNRLNKDVIDLTTHFTIVT